MSDCATLCTIYFDGACPLCSREIAHYRAQAGASSMVWIDAARCEPGALGVGLTRDAALGRLHVRRVDGELVSGVAAFSVIWNGLVNYRWLARLVSGRLVLPVAEIAYSAFLRIRPVWRKQVRRFNSFDAVSSAVRSDLRFEHARNGVRIDRGSAHVAGASSMIDPNRLAD